MLTSAPLTLVRGATGKAGARVANSLVSRGLPAVASATLADPQAHAGARYALTGPEALTIAGAARMISDVSGQAVDYTDIDRDERVAGAVQKATGAPPTSFADFARRTAAARATGETR